MAKKEGFFDRPAEEVAQAILGSCAKLFDTHEEREYFLFKPGPNHLGSVFRLKVDNKEVAPFKIYFYQRGEGGSVYRKLEAQTPGSFSVFPSFGGSILCIITRDGSRIAIKSAITAGGMTTLPNATAVCSYLRLTKKSKGVCQVSGLTILLFPSY